MTYSWTPRSSEANTVYVDDGLCTVRCSNSSKNERRINSNKVTKVTICEVYTRKTAYRNDSKYNTVAAGQSNCATLDENRRRDSAIGPHRYTILVQSKPDQLGNVNETKCIPRRGIVLYTLSGLFCILLSLLYSSAESKPELDTVQRANVRS
jgi:hypothetical protein